MCEWPHLDVLASFITWNVCAQVDDVVRHGHGTSFVYMPLICTESALSQDICHMPLRVVLRMGYCAVDDQCIASVLFGQRDSGLIQVCIETRCEAYVVAVRAEVVHYFSHNLNCDLAISNFIAFMCI